MLPNKLVRFMLHTATALTLTLVCAHADVGYTVSTLAGDKPNASTGHDDGPGSSARFNAPAGVALDSHGNVYVADTTNHTIRKITPGGEVSTFAGSPTVSGFANDTAGAARFNAPSGVAVDRADNVYVADTSNDAIRKITPAGEVTTFVSNLAGPYSLAFDVSGNLYVTQAGATSVLKITPAGSSSTFASSNKFLSLYGIAVDALGNAYVCDLLDDNIKKVTPAGVVSIFSGFDDPLHPLDPPVPGDADGDSTTSRYRMPQGIAVDAAGYVYVSELGGHRIRRLDSSGHATTIAGLSSPATSGFVDDAGSSARFNAPQGLAVDGVGSIYVADTANNSIRKVTRTTVLTISDQPADRSIVVGSPTTFTVTVTGGTGLTYQWRKDGVNINGATAASYSIVGASFADAADYSAVVFNADGLVTTTPAKLTVTGSAAAISQQPGNSTLREHMTASFQAAATGSPTPSFQWQIQQAGDSEWTDLANGGRYTGAQTATLQVTDVTIAADSGDHFRCVVTNLLGTARTNAALLTVELQAVSADFNGDGKPDLVLQNLTTGMRTIRFMNGSTTIGGTSLGSVPAPWSIVATADFNADGKIDLLWQNTVTGERYIWLMNGTSRIGEASLGLVPLQWSIAAAADFNADGKADILWQNTASGERYVWFMNGTTPVSGVGLGIVPVEWSIAAAADFNADGKPDFVWQNTVTGERYVWFMNGITPVSSTSLGVVQVEWSIDSAADYNGDGKPDLLWQNTNTGQCFIWYMNGVTKVGEADLGLLPAGWSLVGAPVHTQPPTLAKTRDFNSDGKADLLWQNTATGERYLWFMNGSTKVGEASLGLVPVEWSLTATADFNADGKPDLLWQNTTTGQRYIWFMNDTTRIGEASLGVVSTNWSIAAAADFNGDSQPDLLWQNTSTGERYVWFMTGTIKIGELSLGVVPAEWSIAAATDFNADGKTDILWQNTVTGERYLWFMNGTNRSGETSLGTVPVEWSIAAAADFNGDGKPDLLWQNNTTGQRYLWFMNGATKTSDVSLGTVPLAWRLVR